MSDTSLTNSYSWSRSGERLRHGIVALVPYVALSVIAAVVFGTLSTHPF